MPDTPFFPQWRPRFAAMRGHIRSMSRQSLLQIETLFAPMLPEKILCRTRRGANSRERIYTLRRTFFAFLWQALNPGCSCREVVRQIQALFALHGDREVDGDTGGFCQARARLPLDVLEHMRRAAAAHAEKALQLWHGFHVKVIDGTSTSLPDTPLNQRAYPQSGAQKPGCGFPQLKILGVFSLASGALLSYARGNKHQHELNLLQSLLGQFSAGDLVLADRGFCSYVLLAIFSALDVHCLFRLHQARLSDLRKGRRLGSQDRLLPWIKPQLKPAYLPSAIWRLIPDQLEVRVLRFTLRANGFRCKSITLATTLTDAAAYPTRELAQLYGQRWNIELWFRDIKTSMGMEVLRCESPRMVHKELEMHFIAYNLIRCLITQSAATHFVPLERLSFKGAVDSLRQFSAAIAQARSATKQRQVIARLLEVIAADPVPERPNRREPRAVKRRPKPFPLLNRPRRKFKEIPHRNRYWKNNPRKRSTLI
jgi:hypothetical protein